MELALCVTTCRPPPYIALEMESGPATPSEDAEAEVLDLLGDLQDMAKSAVRMPTRLPHLFSGRKVLGPRTGSPTPAPAPVIARPRRVLRLVVAGAVAAAAVFLAVPASAPEPPPESPPVVAYVPAMVDDVVMTDMIAGASTPAPQTIERRLTMPDKPLAGQALPPCESPSSEVNGGAG